MSKAYSAYALMTQLMNTIIEKSMYSANAIGITDIIPRSNRERFLIIKNRIMMTLITIPKRKRLIKTRPPNGSWKFSAL
jgi:hypothetical protein